VPSRKGDELDDPFGARCRAEAPLRILVAEKVDFHEVSVFTPAELLQQVRFANLARAIDKERLLVAL
jgi:hypothetical protein